MTAKTEKINDGLLKADHTHKGTLYKKGESISKIKGLSSEQKAFIEANNKGEK